MLFKNWLNYYAWSDMEGSIIERGQNRQEKLDGLHAWRFLYVMDRLQYMLQLSLFLFAFGIMISLWGDNQSVLVVCMFFFTCGLIILYILTTRRSSEGFPYKSFASVRPRDLWSRVRSTFDSQTTLELRSISWILRTSLNEAVRLSTFKYLISIPELHKVDPTLVEDCFHVFIGCISLRNGMAVTIRQGSEQLATVSARCFFRTFHHISVTDPTSSVLGSLRKCYNATFPRGTDFRDLPFQHTMTLVHILIEKRLSPGHIEWDNDGLSTQERIPLAWYMLQAAQVGHETKHKVPRWILRFALHSLSLDPPPPSSVVADCLKVIAIDLDCDVSDITATDERCVLSSTDIRLSDPVLVHKSSKCQP